MSAISLHQESSHNSDEFLMEDDLFFSGRDSWGRERSSQLDKNFDLDGGAQVSHGRKYIYIIEESMVLSSCFKLRDAELLPESRKILCHGPEGMLLSNVTASLRKSRKM
ncbi:hypothetical protein GUITHDRAFT_115175 [Guillardia theta CCMP2712]|uniref:Uncharacterized protein n=1 Tax=Guillardia theta (strain CCMP2712) TaxID=905079 RepID=L1IQU5_GUITC|nr:hypothetical protein GUITHDRAFT_115175 [Guillardia theta CCMP2712]EKX38628.1 hypothetical protein GUITHDRAFT_115175 [Guillardia theta CCMP2712]|mmetsp:Transcript_7681/g.25987  ORF Transcript_7681/g.25987 Transcript_7681/m.25987 type:complete len:109 (-) Transcript_7681:66-392(-)|eukprot:XP_005825608.1 hypothetical protein GUITHDRAFT_115175 [Guillardia theta CCMP2712]